MPDLAAAYHDARIHMSELARKASPEESAKQVPACPDWSVRDLVAHVTSIAAELAAGRFPSDLNLVAFWDDDMSARRETFIDEALESRRERTVDELLDEWEKAAAVLEPMLHGEQPVPPGSPPLVEWIVTTDIGVHVQDLRGALGLEGDGDILASGLALRSYVEAMRMRAVHTGLPAFRMRAGTREWVIGDGDPVATVTGDPWELARAASGRRSPEQIRAYEWDGDPEPFIELFYPYGPRAEALVE